MAEKMGKHQNYLFSTETTGKTSDLLKKITFVFLHQTLPQNKTVKQATKPAHTNIETYKRLCSDSASWKLVSAALVSTWLGWMSNLFLYFTRYKNEYGHKSSTLSLTNHFQKRS